MNGFPTDTQMRMHLFNYLINQKLILHSRKPQIIYQDTIRKCERSVIRDI